MTYEEYQELAKDKGFQALSFEAFEAMIKAGFNFKSGEFN